MAGGSIHAAILHIVKSRRGVRAFGVDLPTPHMDGREAGYAGQLVTWTLVVGGWLLTAVKRKPNSHRFEVLPRRWVAERALAWLTRCRD